MLVCVCVYLCVSFCVCVCVFPFIFKLAGGDYCLVLLQLYLLVSSCKVPCHEIFQLHHQPPHLQSTASDKLLCLILRSCRWFYRKLYITVTKICDGFMKCSFGIITCKNRQFRKVFPLEGLVECLLFLVQVLQHMPCPVQLMVPNLPPDAQPFGAEHVRGPKSTKI